MAWCVVCEGTNKVPRGRGWGRAKAGKGQASPNKIPKGTTSQGKGRGRNEGEDRIRQGKGRDWIGEGQIGGREGHVSSLGRGRRGNREEGLPEPPDPEPPPSGRRREGRR